MSEETAIITRNRAIELINNSIDNFATFYDCYCYRNEAHLSQEQKELYEQMNEVMYIVRKDKKYRNDLEHMPQEDLTAFLLSCKEMAENHDLRVKFSYPKGKIVIVENDNSNTFSHIGNNTSETINSEVKLEEITYFLNNHKSVANWEYNGHGSFIAKKNATLWELGGIYWNKLFELPPNPNLIHIGDEIKLKKEVIDKIYEFSTSDVSGIYSFDPKFPEAKDLIYEIISFCAGASDKVPKTIKYGFIGNDLVNMAETLTEKEETASKLSYFIQQYSTEGKEEDAWEKVLSVTSFFGPLFSALGLLSSASTEENKYQNVRYTQRKAFLGSAQDEIKRIEKLKNAIKEKELKTEIEYLRFLERQIKMLQRELELNDTRDKQQEAEILYTFSTLNTHGVTYKDDRIEKSPEYYHNINYHKLFEEQK